MFTTPAFGTPPKIGGELGVSTTTPLADPSGLLLLKEPES